MATVFQLYGDAMYEMIRKPEPTLLPTQGIFTSPHHIGMVWEELAFNDAGSYTQRNVIVVTAFIVLSPGSQPDRVTD